MMGTYYLRFPPHIPINVNLSLIEKPTWDNADSLQLQAFILETARWRPAVPHGNTLSE